MLARVTLVGSKIRAGLSLARLIHKVHIDTADAYSSEVRALLNDAFPDGAPDELNHYYARHGIPNTTILLIEGHRVVGHLALYEREIRIGNEALTAGLLGEIAVAADCRRRGLGRSLVNEAHERLRVASIPFSILFAYEPRVYVSSGYRLMQNEMRFLDTDGAWKMFVYRGSMYAELLDRPWPDLPIDLRGTAV